MRKSILTGFGLLAGLALLPGADALAQTSAVWLHVRVEETLKPSKVTVNLPLAVVEAALQAAPELIEKHAKMHMGSEDGMKLADLRRVWKQLAAAGDADFVTVDSDQEDVKIRRKGDLVQILVSEKPGVAAAAKVTAEKAPKAEAAPPAKRHGHGEVRVELPVSVVDALLAGEGEQFNVQAAVAELQKRRGDIVRVNDQDSHVRIWIDDQNTQPAAAK
jgi:hypothetical protein